MVPGHGLLHVSTVYQLVAYVFYVLLVPATSLAGAAAGVKKCGGGGVQQLLSSCRCLPSHQVPQKLAEVVACQQFVDSSAPTAFEQHLSSFTS
jgi:hypothetical protein